MDVPVQPGVVHEDLQTAADQQDDEQEVDVVSDTQPGRKALGRRCVEEEPGHGRHGGQPDRGPLNVGHDHRQHKRRNQQQKCASVGCAWCYFSYDQASTERGERRRPPGSAWAGPFVAILFACRADEITSIGGFFQCFFVVGSVAVCLE